MLTEKGKIKLIYDIRKHWGQTWESWTCKKPPYRHVTVREFVEWLNIWFDKNYLKKVISENFNEKEKK